MAKGIFSLTIVDLPKGTDINDVEVTHPLISHIQSDTLIDEDDGTCTATIDLYLEMDSELEDFEVGNLMVSVPNHEVQSIDLDLE